MLAKLRLDQTALYEQAIAAFEVSKMICAFVEGRRYILSIGAEQGDIQGWDDFILQHSVDDYTHLQIKRQQTDFSPQNSCIRNGVAPLTPLDNSMRFLANWINSHNPTSNPIKRSFRLCLPSNGQLIKREIELRNLRDFMALHINSTTTTIGLLNLQSQNDSNAVNIFNWLNTWCEFNDWEHIRKALLLLTITDDGVETDLDLRSTDELARIFNNPGLILSRIKSYIQQNSAYTGNISPRQLLNEFKDSLLDGQKTWTQIKNINGKWEISGIHDLEDNREIERPSKIVPLLWGNDRYREFQINLGPFNNNLSPIHEGIFQLALHLQGNSRSLCSDWQGWKTCITNKIGLTFGDSKDDIENLAISNFTNPYPINDVKTLNTIAERESFAESITYEMMKATLDIVNQKVENQISEMDISHSYELRDLVDVRWDDWKKSLGDNVVEEMTKLFKKMVHPNSEGRDVSGHLRIGPKTQSLLAEALFFLLIISVALDPENRCFMTTEDGLTIGAIGIAFWSGPSGEVRKVREIDDEDTIDELIGKEPFDILLLSKSVHPDNEIYRQPLVESNNTDYSLAGSKRPKLLITSNRRFKAVIKQGTIADMQAYLNRKLEDNRQIFSQTINSNLL